MKFYSVKYDTLFLQLGQALKESCSILEDSSGNSSVLRKKTEAEIVDWLFFGEEGDMLTEFLHNPFIEDEFPESKTSTKFAKYTCVNSEVFTGIRGSLDIDLLIVPENDPRNSIAVQCKKVKVLVDETGDDILNKLGDLRGGAKQAKITTELGFARTYLLLILAIDAARAPGMSVVTRGASDTTWLKVGNALRSLDLLPNVGVVVVTATQLTGKDPESQGDIAIGLFRPATRIEQPSEITERIARYVSLKSSE